MSLERALSKYSETRDAALAALADLTRIPSVSFPGFSREPLEEAARLTQELLRRAGFENAECLRVNNAPPFVFAEWTGKPDAPTVLLYAHYDVQPAGREQLWESPPFAPVTRNGRLYARGIADDKAGILLHCAATGAWLHSCGELPLNVKILIEGEEETGSEHLGSFLRKFRDRIQADCIILADGANYDTGIPSLTTSLRGLVCLDVTVSGMKAPLHSGMWGGPLPDPVIALSKLLGGLLDENGRIAVPGMLDGIIPPTEEEIRRFKALHMTEALFRKQSGMFPETVLFGKGHELLLKMWKEPSLAVNAIEGSNRKMAGNVILNEAWARVGVRLVPGMKPDRVMSLLKKHLEENCPWGLRLTLEQHASAQPWLTPADHPFFGAVSRALSEAYGMQTLCIGSGGSIPFTTEFAEVLPGAPALLTGIEDPYTNAHGENESLDISDFHKAAEGEIRMLQYLSEAG